MYRSVPQNPYARSSAGVPRHVVERLVAERDQLVADQRHLVREVERLRAVPHQDPVQLERLQAALARQTQQVQALQAANQTLTAELNALQERAGTVAETPDSDRVEGLLDDIRTVKRNAQAERERAVRAETTRLLGVVADARDDVVRAMDAADAQTREGLQAVVARLQERLADAGVTVFAEVGDAFDPAMHEAVAVDQGAPGRISAVVSSGLCAEDGRLLRAARVVVGNNQ